MSNNIAARAGEPIRPVRRNHDSPLSEYMIQRRIEEITNPSKENLVTIDEHYHVAVHEALARAAADSDQSISLFSKMKGMFPADVIRQPGAPLLTCGSTADAAPPEYHPELHALDYEWYFTNLTARQLSHEYASRNGTTICLGAPKVAAAALAESRRVISVDQEIAMY